MVFIHVTNYTVNCLKLYFSGQEVVRAVAMFYHLCRHAWPLNKKFLVDAFSFSSLMFFSTAHPSTVTVLCPSSGHVATLWGGILISFVNKNA